MQRESNIRVVAAYACDWLGQASGYIQPVPMHTLRHQSCRVQKLSVCSLNSDVI